MRAYKAYRYRRDSRLQKKTCASKTFLKMTSGRMHTPHPTLLDSPLAYATETIKRVWRISLFQSLGTISFELFIKKQSQKGRA